MHATQDCFSQGPETVFRSWTLSRFLSSLNFINCFRNGAGSLEIAKRFQYPPLQAVDGIMLETISPPFLNSGWRETEID